MLLLLLLCLFASSEAHAVLIATGTANATAPPDDPGWAHVGTRTGTGGGGGALNGLTLIYLGNGWVLTANHVGEADLLLDGVAYPRISGSKVRFQNADLSDADLMAFQIVGNPELPNLPILEISATSPAIGEQVTMIGRGRNRGTATTWFEPPSGPLREGWLWASTAKIRWGTNQIANPAIAPTSTTTDSLISDFTKPGDAGFTSEEAQVVLGDSGGAVFHKVGPDWALAGVIHSAVQYAGQNPGSSLDGNISYFADLASFRSQIIPVVRPECSDEVDNDGDGNTDYPDDPQCSSRESDNESAHLPSLSPLALTALVALLAASAILFPGRSKGAAA